MPLRAAALLVGLGVSHSADPREGEEGLQAAVGAQHDVRVEAVAHHQAAVGVHAKLGGHAVKHVVVGFAHSLSLALGSGLNSLQQAACTWEEEMTINTAILNILVKSPLQSKANPQIKFLVFELEMSLILHHQSVVNRC